MGTSKVNATAEIQPPPPTEKQGRKRRQQPESEEIVLASRPQLEYLQPVVNLDMAKRRLDELQQFVRFYLKEGEDYGVIPGTKSRTLLKPGSDKLCDIYGLADTYPDSRIKRNENWQLEPPLFDYEICCVLIHKGTGLVVGEGLGSCNSYEAKYRWRDQGRSCPECGKSTILRSKYDDCGWYCFAKKGGCGAKFAFNDPKIVGQSIGRIPNPDVADLKNTVLKMAAKRAKVNAIISVTRSSGIFTQDVEDITLPENGNGKQVAAEVIPPAPEEPALAPTHPAPTHPAPTQPYSLVDNTMPCRDLPTVEDHSDWLVNSNTMEELMKLFAAGYRQFANDPQAQSQLRSVYEKHKARLGGTPNPKGKTKKQETKNGKNGRN